MLTSDLRQYAPATERNRQPILDILRTVLPRSGRILEIGSGTGEHVVYFAQALSSLIWQPTEGDAQALPSIQAWIDHYAPANVLAPRLLDVHQADWGIEPVDAILCCNVIHYSPSTTTVALLKGAASLLKPGGVLYLYGPFRCSGKHTAPSNEAFDQWLKQRNPSFGVRDLETVQTLANQLGLITGPVIEMPANNLSVVFQKSGSDAPKT